MVRFYFDEFMNYLKYIFQFYCQSIQPIEETMVKAIYSYYLIQDHPDMNYSIVEGRRSIERRLYRSQTMREPQHIIEKHWYDQWTNFIYGN